MRVKKFEAKNMKDALHMVKKELGPDAVILSARDNRKNYGIAGDTSVEITAAVSETTLQKKRFVESRMTQNDREKFQNSDARTQRKIIERMVDARTQSTEKEKRAITSTSYIDIPDEELQQPTQRRSQAFERAQGRYVQELLEDFEQDFDVDPRAARQSQPRPAQPRPTQQARGAQAYLPPPQEQEEPAPSETAIARIRNAAREAWKANPFFEEEQARQAKPRQASQPQRQAPLQQDGGMDMYPRAQAQQQPQARPTDLTALPSAQAPAPQSQEIATLKSEISRLQQMLEGFQKVPQSFVAMHPGAEYGISYDLSFMFQKLVEAGLTIDNTVEILQQASREIDPVAVKKRPIVDAWVARHLLTNIQIAPQPFQGRMHLFVGGSGSGKTSTLVKMASHFVVKEKKKVAVLSTDSFKVGAVDQLKIYCQILNVPFAVIRNRAEWEWVIGQLRHVDHVLVDFPGLQLRDLDEIHLLKSLLPPAEVAPITHFCVAATAKDGDAYEIAKRYKVADYQDLVVTNLDQSVQHGIIYNLQKKTGKPLHSFGIGNRIPEDFEPASKERVLDLIFKLTKLRRET